LQNYLLFCSPTLKRETIAKVALTLIDAGLPITSIGPGYIDDTKLNAPKIELMSFWADDSPSPSLTREQISSITDCTREYRSDGRVRRLLAATNQCHEILDVYVAYFDPEEQNWLVSREAEQAKGRPCRLTDSGQPRRTRVACRPNRHSDQLRH
jgi:hypothetical protein